MTESSSLHGVLQDALVHILHLEGGLPSVARVNDPGQRAELDEAKKHILNAINLQRDARPAIGGALEDGTILAGYCEGKPLYTTPVDEPLTVTFKGAATQADVLNMTNALGHHDWRVPTPAELKVLYNNRAAIGGFDESGSDPGGWYWSSLQDDQGAWATRFSDGREVNDYDDDKSQASSLRLVRG